MAERESTTWRMAAEFVLEPMEGHEVRAATGYGSRYVRAQELAGEGLHDRGVGTLSVEDRWQIAEGVTAGVGGKFSYVGFLGDTSHFDPSASLEIQGADRTTFRGSIYARTVAPGGDILTLSSLASAPAMNFAVLDGGLRAERLTRYELTFTSSGASDVRTDVQINGKHATFEDGTDWKEKPVSLPWINPTTYSKSFSFTASTRSANSTPSPPTRATPSSIPSMRHT